VNASRWQRVNQIFHEALEHDATTRESYLHQATEGDPDLLREVQTLLASHASAGEFLDRPAWAVEPELAMGDEVSLAGKQLGAYRILEEIGRGGMGVVYAAQDERLRRTVALKALTPEYTRDPGRRERLTREARAAAALLHPAIATIFALEEIDGELYITSELVRGRTLREELRDGPVPPSQLLPTLVTIADALAAAHGHGIVHRDLKPENIIRRDDGQIKVLDFGLAQSPPRPQAAASTRLTEVGSALGTPGYMAPEQLSGKEVDARADIFAFGVLVWELATGEHPFGTDPASILARMTELIEGRASGLSRPLPLPGLDRIARRCMRASPAERYPTAEALLVDLRALESGTITAFTPPRHDAFWWWQFHQHIVAIVNAAAPAAIWSVRQWVGSSSGSKLGSRLFLAALTLATISVALRLNLSFTARVHPSMLVDHRARTFPAIAAIDTLLALSLFVAAALIADAHDAVAAILVALAAVMLASLSLIEPATTKAAGLTPQKNTR
jgi:serine/threonine protein kinase